MAIRVTPYLSLEEEEKILIWIDKFIEFLPEYEKDLFSSMAMNLKCDQNLYYYVEETLKRLNIFEGEHLLNFSDFGREVKKAGNYSKYLEQKEIEKKIEKHKNDLEVENLKYSIMMNKWLLRTKWVPHILSLLAFILAVISLFL
jgi:hypothetical protein